MGTINCVFSHRINYLVACYEVVNCSRVPAIDKVVVFSAFDFGWSKNLRACTSTMYDDIILYITR